MRIAESKIISLTYAALMSMTLLWAGGAIAAPLLEAAPARASQGSILSAPAYYVYGQVCHQIAERSFSLAGQPIAVCSRCSGIYAGFLVGLILFPFLCSLKRADAPPRFWFALALVPTAIDFSGDYMGLFENTLASRAITGSIAGAAVTFYILPGLISVAIEWFGRSKEVMGDA